jgi:hypothetical protein
MLQCIYIASVHNDLLQYKHTFMNQHLGDSQLEMAPYTVGLIGCG